MEKPFRKYLNAGFIFFYTLSGQIHPSVINKLEKLLEIIRSIPLFFILSLIFDRL